MNITPGQARVLDAILKTGTAKGAALLLGISRKTAEAQATLAAKRLGGICRLHLMLMRDRFNEAQRRAVDG